MLVKPPDRLDEFPIAPVPEQFQFVGCRRVAAELRLFPGLHPLWPHVPQQLIAQPAKLKRLVLSGQLERKALGAVPQSAEGDRPAAGSQVGAHGTGDARAGLDDGAVVALEFEQDIVDSDVTLIANVSDQHGTGSE